MRTILSSKALLLALTLGLGASLASPSVHARDRHAPQPVQIATAHAAGELGEQLYRRAHPTRSVLVLSAQNLDDLNRSEGLGRLVGELVQSTLVNQGYRVKEVRLRDSIRISGEGEQGLSRDLARLASEHAAEVVIVSTYSRSNRTAYITVKAVRVADGLILASKSFTAQVPSGL